MGRDLNEETDNGR